MGPPEIACGEQASLGLTHRLTRAFVVERDRILRSFYNPCAVMFAVRLVLSAIDPVEKDIA